MLDRAGISFAAERGRIDRALAACCAADLDRLAPAVATPIRYSLLGEGKRLRGILLMRAYDAAGGSGDVAPLGAAVEVVHAYSLIHDDLPCMDDDDVRRGRPTVHRAFDVRSATAAGLAMVPLAASYAMQATEDLELSNELRGTIVRELTRAAGAGGMIGGQLLDLEAEGTAPSIDDLERIHGAKTGALIAASARIGALAAMGSERVVEALHRFGEAIGLAFQIADDVLDVTATTDQLGKTAGRDAALKKSTFPSVLGVEGARVRAEDVVRNARLALDREGLLTDGLSELALYVVARRS